MITNDETKLFHTAGLDEVVRCSMCQNAMRSDTGCDGNCNVNKKMYDSVMKAIKSQMVKEEPESDESIKPELEKWIVKIEARRFEDWKDILKEQRSIQAECDAYTSQYRSYSAEEMRDYGHTWGPGFEPEKPEVKLPKYYKIQDKQLDVLKEMIQDDHYSDEDIEYIFLNKCAWDDEYKICQMANGFTMKDVLMCLFDFYRSEANFYHDKIEKEELIWDYSKM